MVHDVKNCCHLCHGGPGHDPDLRGHQGRGEEVPPDSVGVGVAGEDL